MLLTPFILFTLIGRAARGANVINIRTAQEFIKFSSDVNSGSNLDATVFLQNDIDFAGLSGQFQSIGKYIDFEKSFSGVFDGQGHTVSYLTLQNTDYWDFGLFGVSCGATVRNLIMDRTCSVVGRPVNNGTLSNPVSMNLAGIVGRCQSFKSECLIENNIFMGKIELAGTLSEDIYVHVGGVVGESSAWKYPTTVKNSVNYGTITFSGRADRTTIGGIVGYLSANFDDTKSYLYNCLNYGLTVHIGTTAKFLTIGGILGSNDYGNEEIDNTVDFGSILTNSRRGYREDRIGSLVGYLYESTVSHSYWVSGTKSEAVGYNDGGSLSECPSFSSNSFALARPVNVGDYSGSSLINAINAGADLHSSSRRYSKWLLNRGNKAVLFAVNNERPFFRIESQLILMPNLADSVEKKFYGWYTDSACIIPLTNFEITIDISLYGKWA